MSETPSSAIDEERAGEKQEVAPSDAVDHQVQDSRRDARLAMTLLEAEVIAQNLKESGTRR